MHTYCKKTIADLWPGKSMGVENLAGGSTLDNPYHDLI